MWAGQGISMAQLISMLPDPEKQAARRRQRRSATFASPDGCGCCPICRDFVYVQFTQAGALASCPHCRGLIESLDPLGAPPST
jgi:hypothetical protein